jgi:hypothetical protein
MKEYLGDAVYVRRSDFDNSLILTTENGISTTNEIYLYDDVYSALLEYVKRNP